MPQQIVIAEQLRIAALLSDERVDELIVAQGRYQIGDVFLGTVENVLPGIDAAFVNIGESEKNGFIHVSDLGPLRLKKGASGITELLEPRQKVLVQVMKEPTGTKGPRLTGNLSLPGRYLVLQPHGQGVNISRRISSEGERNRLRALGVLIKPPGAGLLIRTEGEEISEELLIDDLESLLKQWEAIQQASEEYSPPVLLNRDDDFIHRVLRDHAGNNLTKVIVENDNAKERVQKFLSNDGNNLLVETKNESTNLLEQYRINNAIREALQPRVELPSGGYIIIEPTEALTVIDVNSGSFTRSANARETVLWTNCEAAIEIARQLKLRNIGGVIIIDFIDMESRRDQLQLLEHFTSAVKDDSARPQIAQLTELGLVELTRKRQGQNIYELFGKPCQNCCGLGHIAVLPEQELIQPLASAAGLIRSASSKAELNSSVETNNAKRKKGARNRLGNENLLQSQTELSNQEVSTEAEDNLSENSDEGTSSEFTNNRQEPELITVRIDTEEEQVYSSLGLNPMLLLDPIPEHDNLLVSIVRHDEDEEAILEEARNQLAALTGKRRRRGRSNNKTMQRNGNENISSIDSETLNMDSQTEESKDSIRVEITSEEETKSLNKADKVDPSSSLKPDLEKQPDPEDPRRRRRRSSASKEGQNAT